MERGYRHEYKYLISRADAELLKLRLPHIMERDTHSGDSGRYTIRSLYFDDFANTAYYEKVDGVAQRAKYRIRFYDYDSSLIKLEKKNEAKPVSFEDAKAQIHERLLAEAQQKAYQSKMNQLKILYPVDMF